ncbi:hypothetical protein [Bacillus velezensis]|uniref:hypothetical protein n=1 Tax=Bacillus velezensis TaxID=492670 RepID=UPI001A915234|nr:hypothetical protein [Bacillus velezensis]BCT30460.1 hypothetical protein BVAD3_41340 [Bacillus velezensis]
MQRTPFLKAMVGSHNYNLQVPESDKDYKFFVLPNFDDMYSNRDFAKSYQEENGNDLEYKDARQLPHLWWKTNVNFTEVLFSKEITTFDNTEIYVQLLLSYREEIARMNLPYLHRSTKGMMKTKVLKAEKGRRMEIYGGADPDSKPWGKDIMTAYRIGDTFLRYHNNHFESFEEAFRYSNDERSTLLSLRNQEISYKEACDAVLEIEEKLKNLEFSYSEQDGLKTKQFVDDILKQAVTNNLLREFNYLGTE